MESNKFKFTQAQKFYINISAFALLTGSFLIGSITGIAGLVSIALFYFWFASVVGMFGFMDILAIEVHKDKPQFSFGLPQWLDITLDMVTLTIMVYFGYIWLGVFWMLHIMGMAKFRENVEKLQNGTGL